jgi:hypothetical protein
MAKMLPVERHPVILRYWAAYSRHPAGTAGLWAAIAPPPMKPAMPTDVAPWFRDCGFATVVSYLSVPFESNQGVHR